MHPAIQQALATYKIDEQTADIHDFMDVGTIRLYIDRDAGNFLALSLEAGESWTDPNMCADILLHGWGTFDGIRHLYIGVHGVIGDAQFDKDGSTDIGYLYYPDMKAIAAILTTLDEAFPDTTR